MGFCQYNVCRQGGSKPHVIEVRWDWPAIDLGFSNPSLKSKISTSAFWLRSCVLAWRPGTCVSVCENLVTTSVGFFRNHLGGILSVQCLSAGGLETPRHWGPVRPACHRLGFSNPGLKPKISTYMRNLSTISMPSAYDNKWKWRFLKTLNFLPVLNPRIVVWYGNI